MVGRCARIPLAFGLLLALCVASRADTVARCGNGWLEEVNGVLVLHLKGSPYEMGYQHGALLREHCRENFQYLLGEKSTELLSWGPLKLNPRVMIEAIVEQQRKYVPERYFEEMQGLADACGLSLADVRAGNFIPELFHCSGFAVMNSATKDGTLYHGRVLDYACDWNLQKHAVIIVAEPEGGIPFANVSYAGFIGSVTGMNAQKIAIGEMGGLGFGHWEGVPMALLMRQVLEQAGTLSDAVATFRDQPRTCVYYYVVSDGKTNEALGMATNWTKMVTIGPGESHRLLPRPVVDAVLLSAGERYQKLVERVQQRHGQIEAADALRLMDRPVAMSSNLHNVLFEPKSTTFWVAQASLDGEPAATQPYRRFQLSELLLRAPDDNAQIIPLERVAKQ